MFALTRAGARRRKGATRKNDGETRTVCARRSQGIELSDHVKQEEQGTVVNARQPGAEATGETELLVFPYNILLLFFQSTPKADW